MLRFARKTVQGSYPLIKGSVFKYLYRGCLLGFSLTLSANLWAQAGSSSPIIFDSAEAFFDSVSLGFNSNSGVQQLAMVPRGLLKVPADEKYVFWVELASGRLNILEQQDNRGFIVRQIIPVSLGTNGYDKQQEGDKRTPVGVYHFTSFLKDEQLIDFYGLGAFPISYPNALDLLAGKTGSGIWLHGLPKNVSERPLLDSDGCVVIDNNSLLQMMNYIETGRTPVILTESPLEWVPLQSEVIRTESLAQALEIWRQAWESKDNNRYLAWYAEDFSDLSRNLSEWSDYKRRVNDSKTFIDVNFSDVSFISDPQHPDIVIVRYFQTYRSSNYSWSGWKQQLWQQRGSDWQIVYEGNA